MKVIYTAHATAIDGRNGHVETDDKNLVLELQGLDSKIKKSGTTTNPEQLFACAYAACFGSSIEAIANKQNIDAKNISVTAHIKLLKENGSGLRIGAELNVSIPNIDANIVQDLVNKAHLVCPYSKATQGNIEVEIKVVP